MIQISIPQVLPVTGSTPQEAAELFNKTIMELAPLHPTFKQEGNTFWIYYSVEYREPENVCEEYEQKGEGAYCVDCPFCVRDRNRFGDIDVRKKWATCAKRNGERIRIDSRACDTYYTERG